MTKELDWKQNEVFCISKTRRDGAKWCNIVHDGSRECKIMQFHAIPCNTMQYSAIPWNTMQYHASLISADGAYHCPVGSIWLFLSPSCDLGTWNLRRSEKEIPFCFCSVSKFWLYQRPRHRNLLSIPWIQSASATIDKKILPCKATLVRC